MKKVYLSCNSPKLVDYIMVNGESVNFVKEKGKLATFTYEFETDKDTFKLNLDTFHPYLQHNWWIKLFFLKIISILGIFDSHYHPQYVYHYDAEVTLKEATTDVRINAGGYQHKAALVEGNNIEVKETENSLEKDKRIKKRKALLALSLIAFTLVVVGIIVLALFLKK